MFLSSSCQEILKRGKLSKLCVVHNSSLTPCSIVMKLTRWIVRLPYGNEHIVRNLCLGDDSKLFMSKVLPLSAMKIVSSINHMSTLGISPVIGNV